MDPGLLKRHLPGADPLSRPLWADHPLWFGGRSRRWPGGVAFLGLRPGGRPTRCRAYAVDRDDLTRILCSENRVSAELPDLTGLGVGEHLSADLPLSADGTIGKYDAVLRLPDLDGRPVFTVTTSRALEPRPPAPAYAAAIEQALVPDLGADRAAEYLRQRFPTL
ncbi:hypothetical protein HJ590_03895 [Naumannella sp. ID2617S]|nr:hypothetical protein [Naumannella sp. ID2617S]